VNYDLIINLQISKIKMIINRHKDVTYVPLIQLSSHQLDSDILLLTEIGYKIRIKTAHTAIDIYITVVESIFLITILFYNNTIK
jgi:hypothetical protein